MEQTTCLELVLMQNLLLIISFTFELSLKLGIMFSTQFQISMSMRKLCLTHHLLKLKYAKHGSKHTLNTTLKRNKLVNETSKASLC